ncbi:hypothetical protein HMPREF0992_00365 [Lachnospiraceae bacterium 6_1_63FAA]|nr:hypothetical protein HMPREF0992_00365 [Lachnospiraceae bacterium 6_1_63FAA]
MRIKKIQMIFFLFLLFSIPVQASNGEQGNTQEQLLDSMELEKMQEAVNELLGEETFSVKESIKKALSGEEPFSAEHFGEIGKAFLYQQLLPDKKILVQVILLVLAASLFSNFTGMFGKGETGGISFYMVYLFLLTILMKSFGQMSRIISSGLEDFVFFMKALMPSYFLAVTAAGGVASAMIFYNMVLAVIYVIQVILLKLVVPGIHLFVLFQLVKYLHKEDILSKMAEFFKTILEWTLHTCVAVLVGMQVIQNMISPAVDSLKRDVIGKTATAIPAVGNAIDGVTEVALGTAVLIRNCIGVVGILVLLLLGLPPIIRLGVTTLIYKLLAAVVQPVADKRMTGCLSTMGEGCRLLLRVLLTVELLSLITIAILSVSFTSH